MDGATQSHVLRAGHPDVLSRHPAPRWRLSVTDYHRMAEVGILREDDRVELIEGQLVAMCPIGPRHALAVDRLVRLLFGAAGSQAWVRVQNPVTLDDGSEPNPDVMLVRNGWTGYPTQHPGPEDILLLVEVADSSIATDQGAKRELYARGKVQEFWIVDLTRDVVHVHRDPRDGAYASVVTRSLSETLDVAALPGVSIAAISLFT